MSGEKMANGVEPLDVGVAAHSFGYLGGFYGAGTDRACVSPLDAYRLMDLAASRRLAGVEIPVAEYLRGMSETELARVRRYGEDRGLNFVLDSGVVDVAEIRGALRAASGLGARTIRVIASEILCGDRREMASTWRAHLDGVVDRLRLASEIAGPAGVSIALENHQDLTSEELAVICERVGNEHVGATLDAVNPLAVAEDPLEYARRLGPIIKHVHLKDYKVYGTAQGFRLVRCALGSGVLDVSGLLKLLRERAPEATSSVELGALESRHVRFLEEDFWSGYPPRRFEQVLPVLHLRESRARPPGEEWRTPWEMGAGGDALSAYEMDEFDQSLVYLRRISAGEPRS